MSGIDSLLPNGIPESYKPLMAALFVFLAGLAIWLLISIVMTCVQGIKRRSARRRFADRYGVPVPSEIEVRRNKKATTDGYALRCPTWRQARRDGTRDRRYKGNNLEAHASVMWVDGWEIVAYDPIIMNSFVIELRRQGHDLPACSQELEKYDEIASRRDNQFVGSSCIQLYARFMDDSTGFEEWCAQLLRDRGAQVRVTPPSNDGGYDLDIWQDGIRTIAECKCYHPTDGVVGRPLLQKLVGANASEHAQHMMFMTTSRYSNPAVAYAREQGIELLDGEELMRMNAERRGEAPESDASSGKGSWFLTDGDILKGYPADYAGTPLTGGHSGSPAAYVVLKLLALGTLAWVLTQMLLNADKFLPRIDAGGLFPNASDVSQQGASGIERNTVEEAGRDSSTEKAKAESHDSQYILPSSNTEPVSMDFLMGMSVHDLFVARNEIYARHGYIFEMKELRERFEACPWYVPKTPGAEFDDSVLSQTEHENVRRILSVEVPKETGRASYVATYLTKDYAERHPDQKCAYDGRIDGSLLRICGTWKITDDSGQHDEKDCTEWCFRIADDVLIQVGGGDGENSEPRPMTREDLVDRLTNPSGLGLRLTTNENGEVTAVDWMS